MKILFLLLWFPLLTFAKEKNPPNPPKSTKSTLAAAASSKSKTAEEKNHGDGAVPPSGATSNAGAGHSAPRMTGWEAFSELQDGNMRFFEGKSKHLRQEISHREALANGQKPHTIVISCSDSRLPPEVVFDQGLGDLFVVRLAGNVLNPEAIASIEYAISHLGAKLITVMGHESCGAVGAAIGTKPGTSAGSESLDVLVKHIRSHLSADAISSANTDKTFRQPVKENVAATMTELMEKSEIVRKAVTSQGVVLAQAMYSPRTGRVEFWELGQKVAGQSPAASVVVADGPAIPEQVVKEEIVTDSKAPPEKAVKSKTKVAPPSVH